MKKKLPLTPFDNLPEDILRYLLLFLEFTNINTLNTVSKGMNQVIKRAFENSNFSLNLIRYWMEIYFGEGLFPKENTVDMATKQLANAQKTRKLNSEHNLFELYHAIHIIARFKNEGELDQQLRDYLSKNVVHVIDRYLDVLYEAKVLGSIFYAKFPDVFFKFTLLEAIKLAEEMYNQNKTIFTFQNLLRYHQRIKGELQKASMWFYKQDLENESRLAKLINSLIPEPKGFLLPKAVSEKIKSLLAKAPQQSATLSDKLERQAYLYSVKRLRHFENYSLYKNLPQEERGIIELARYHVTGNHFLENSKSLISEYLSTQEEFLEEFNKLSAAAQTTFIQLMSKPCSHVILSSCLEYKIWPKLFEKTNFIDTLWFQGDLFRELFQHKLLWMFKIYTSQIFEEITKLFDFLSKYCRNINHIEIINIFANPVLESYARKTGNSLTDIWNKFLTIVFAGIDVEPFLNTKAEKTYKLLCQVALSKVKIPPNFQVLAKETSLNFALTLLLKNYITEDIDRILALYNSYPIFKSYCHVAALPLVISFDEATLAKLSSYLYTDEAISLDLFYFVCQLLKNESSYDINEENKILNKFTHSELKEAFNNKALNRFLLRSDSLNQYWLKMLTAQQILSLKKPNWRTLSDMGNNFLAQTNYLKALFPPQQEKPLTILSTGYCVSELPQSLRNEDENFDYYTGFSANFFPRFVSKKETQTIASAPESKEQERKKLIEAIKEKRKKILCLQQLHSNGFFKRTRVETDNESAKKQKQDKPDGSDHNNVIDLT